MTTRKKTEKPKQVPIAEPSVADLDAVAHEQAMRNATAFETDYNRNLPGLVMGQYEQSAGIYTGYGRIPLPWGFVLAICVSLSVVAVLVTGWGLYAFVRPKLQITLPQQAPATVTVQPVAACSDTTVMTATLAAQAQSLVLTATDEVWIKIQGVDGTALFEGTVPQGWKKTYMLSSDMLFMVRTGKPDALQFRLGDQELALNNEYAGTRNLGVYVVDGKQLLK